MGEVRLIKFLTESNYIEGEGPPTRDEMEAARGFLNAPTLENLRLYVNRTASAQLRDSASIPGVRVGNHIAPPSGPEIKHELMKILDFARQGNAPIYDIHQEYEHLHPFTDGNGRSGRLIWYFMRQEYAPIGFLRQWYYDSLSAWRRK